MPVRRRRSNSTAGLLRREAGGIRPVEVPGADVAYSGPAGDRPAVIARGGNRVVGAVGVDAAADALRPAATLGGTELYAAGKALVGDRIEPSFLVSVPAALKVFGEDVPSSIRRYLNTLTVAAAGGTVEDRRVDLRIAAALR